MWHTRVENYALGVESFYLIFIRLNSHNNVSLSSNIHQRVWKTNFENGREPYILLGGPSYQI